MKNTKEFQNPLRIFVHRSDVYARGFSTGERAAYSIVHEQVTDQLLQDHLDGKITLGMYQLGTDETVRWCCFDFDKDTVEDFEDAKKLYEYLKKGQYQPLFEFSGGGEYRVHVWVFCEPILAKTMRVWARNVCKTIGVFPHEIFPKQDKRPNGKYGNLVKLPLGLHPFTKRRCFVLDERDEKTESVDALRRFDNEHQ